MAKMTNPMNSVQFERLKDSIEWSDRQLEFPRKKRIEAIRQLVGYHHVEDGARKRVPVNFIKLAVNVFLRRLAARAPKCMITSKDIDLRPTAKNLELAVNQVPDEINLQQTFRLAVLEAIFSIGIVKCGLHKVGEILGHSYGESFADIVTIDDLLIDMSAKHMDYIQYIGNGYWLNYEDVMEDNWFDKDAKNGLMHDEYTTMGIAGEQRAEEIAQGEQASLFKDKVWLRDIWIPSEGLMVTYSVKQDRRLKVVELKDRPRGPYHILGFDDVPGNLLPMPPVAIWRDLHDLANALYRKVGDAADAQKTVLGFQGDNDSVENFQKAKDGDGIVYSGPPPTRLQAGGIDQSTLAFLLATKDLASWFAGNIDALGGLSPQAQTLGQDKMLIESASAQLKDMASKVVDFAKEIFKDLVYYEWNNPIKKRKIEKPIPGTGLALSTTWDRSSKRGKLSMYDIDINVYSMQDDSPSVKLQKLGMIMQNYILPLMPAIEADGGSIDVQAILGMVAKYADFDELNEIVQFVNDRMGQKQQSGNNGMPANTTRTYSKTTTPGKTQSGSSQVLQELLLGGNPQPSEAVQLNR